MTNERMDAAELDAERLEGALARLAQGEPLEQIVAEIGRESELASLVALGGRMSVVLPTAAPQAMRRRQEAVLRQRVASLASPPKRRAGGLGGWFALPRPAVTFAAVALAVAALGTTGAVVASASSLPGDPLYGVKRAVETTRLAVAFDPVDRVALRLAFAGERIDEIRALIDRGVMPDPEVIEELIALYAASARDAAAGAMATTAIDDRRAADAALLGALARESDPAVQRLLAEAVARLVGPSTDGAVATPAAVPGVSGSGGAVRVGPTVARPSEAVPEREPTSTATPAGSAQIVAPPPTATSDVSPLWPSPEPPTPDVGGGGGAPIAPPQPTSAPIGDPPAAATSVPQEPPPSSIEEQRRRDLNNTPPPPPPRGRPGHGGGSPPPRP